MADFFLTNRELGALSSMVLWAAVAVWVSRRDGSGDRLLRSLRGLLSAIANKAILMPAIVYLCWLSAALYAADAIGLWDLQLVKAAVLWLLLSGLGLFGTGVAAVEHEGAITDAFKRLLGAVVVFEFMAGFASFPVYVEVPAQIVALPCAFASAMGELRPEYRRAGKLALGYLSLLGLSAIAWGIARLVSERTETDWGLWWRELVMPFWLTPVALIFIALFALYLVYDATFSVMRSQSAAGLTWRHRLAVLARCGLRLRAVRAVRPSAPWLANDQGFRATWRWASRALRRDRDQRTAEAAKAQRLIDNADVVGTDAAGIQLDQREHAETKKALRWLHTCHVGHYAELSNRYVALHQDIIDRLPEKYGLPTPGNFKVHIASDGQSWYAARRTITGHWFAIGAAGPPTDQWFYDGPTPPSGFPSESEWDQWIEDSHSPNWADPPETHPNAVDGAPTPRRRSKKSDRPSWCLHYDEWKRADDEIKALESRNTICTTDWTQEDLRRLAELIDARGEASGRMWGEAPDSENWDSARIKCE